MKPARHKRIAVYVNEKKYKRLRARLLIQGLTVSEWARQLIDNYLKKNGKDFNEDESQRGED